MGCERVNSLVGVMLGEVEDREGPEGREGQTARGLEWMRLVG